MRDDDLRPAADPDAALPRLLDGDLTPAEVEDLNRALAADPALRRAWRDHALEAVVAGEALRSSPWREPPAARRRGRWLAVAAAAALVAAAWLSLQGGPGVVVTAVEGECRRAPAGGVESACPAGTPARPGDTFRTDGPASSAALAFPGGTHVALWGDTTLTAGDDGRSVRLHAGHVTADLAAGPPDRLETAEALVEADRARVRLSRQDGQTVVAVAEGAARVTDRARGETVAVRRGEAVTVTPAAPPVARRAGGPPTAWAADFVAGPPPGWLLGEFLPGSRPPAVRARTAYVPHHSRNHYQVISQNGWTHGLFAFTPHGHLTATIRVDRPGLVQTLLVVREATPGPTAVSKVYVHDGLGRGARPGEWHTARLRLGDFHPTSDTPAPAGPVAFLVIFDTHDADLGLAVAEVRAGAGP